MTDRPLSPRHQRFVAEYLRDGNATQAYVRAGYAARGAQSCASRLLAQPHIETALSAGRQRIAQSLQVTVERVAQEYAAIAFAPVDLDLDHGKALQTRRLKLQALAALTRHLDLFTEKPQPGLTPEDRQRYEAAIAQHERNGQHALEELRRLERERDEARIALAAAEAKLAASDRPAAPTTEPIPLQTMARREQAEPSPPPDIAKMFPRGIPARDTPEFRELLGRLRRGALDRVMTRRMIQAGYGPEPEPEKPDMTYQMECEYEPDWGGDASVAPK